MKLNPYSILLMVVFIGITKLPIQKTKNYEKNINDSCVCPNDSTVSLRKV